MKLPENFRHLELSYGSFIVSPFHNSTKYSQWSAASGTSWSGLTTTYLNNCYFQFQIKEKKVNKILVSCFPGYVPFSSPAWFPSWWASIKTVIINLFWWRAQICSPIVTGNVWVWCFSCLHLEESFPSFKRYLPNPTGVYGNLYHNLYLVDMDSEKKKKEKKNCQHSSNARQNLSYFIFGPLPSSLLAYF